MDAANDNEPARADWLHQRICAFCVRFRHASIVIDGTTVGWCEQYGATVWAHSACPSFERKDQAT